MMPAAAVRERLPIRALTTIEELEATGIDVHEVGTERVSKHILLVPVNGRLADVRYVPTRTPKESKWDPDHVPVLIKGKSVFAWDRVERVEVDSLSTKRCLWDLVDLDADDPASLVGFVRKWGILGIENPDYEDPLELEAREDWISLTAVGQAAKELAAIVYSMIDIENGQLPSAAELYLLNHSALDPEFIEDPRLEGMTDEERRAWSVNNPHPRTYPEFHQYLAEIELGRWRRELSAGRGRETHRRLFLAAINNRARQPRAAGELVWDEKGRRALVSSAVGASEIIGEHLYVYFTSPELDFFSCSVCGKAFPFDESQSERRPRAGMRRFCSPECRADGKRQANRDAWHRNKARWAKPRSLHQESTF